MYRSVCVVCVVLIGSSAVTAQTPLPGGFEIRLLPGYAHEPLRGIDSIVGKIGKKDGLQIQYEMGPIPAPGFPRVGGHFVNQASLVPVKDRAWFKEQNTGSRTVYIAYGKDNQLVISSTSTTEGINFHTVAKTPEEVADAILMAVTFAQKAKPGK